jgi:hypothetical protein
MPWSGIQGPRSTISSAQVNRCDAERELCIAIDEIEGCSEPTNHFSNNQAPNCSKIAVNPLTHFIPISTVLANTCQEFQGFVYFQHLLISLLCLLLSD